MKRLLIFLFLIYQATLGVYSQELKQNPASGLYYMETSGSTSSTGNIVILLHGYGSNEQDLFDFKNLFPKDHFICLRAPITRVNNSYSWYDIKFYQNGKKDRNLYQANASIEKIISFIKTLHKKDDQKVVLGGFSQGAILSMEIAIRYPELVDGIICFSGMPLDKNDDSVPGADYGKIKAFYGHGTEDNVIPIDQGRLCKETLKELGFNLTYAEYPMKHQIIQEELQHLMQWYRDNF